MKIPETQFFVARNGDVKPWEAALDWLIQQNLKPGDLVWQSDITAALGMIDPDSLGSRALIRKWELARIPEASQMRATFEERTGLILETNHSGAYEVLDPDEVSAVVLETMQRRIKNAIDRAQVTLSRADKTTASSAEMIRRSQVSQYVNNAAEFMSRKRRSSLDDAVDSDAA